jgi:uncharacterized protein (DUF433 family)
MDFRDIIQFERGRRGGKPSVRGLRITVQDVLGWLFVGMTAEEIVSDYPELTAHDVRACLQFALNQRA